jgi:hypothetical protein
MIPTNGMVARWVVCIVMLLPLLAVGKDKKQQEGEALLTKARELSNIRCQGCPPFKMKARVHLFELAGGPGEGTYTVFWESPGKWRDEIDIAGYTELRVAQAERVFVKRSIRFQPYRVNLLREMVELPTRIALPQAAKVVSIEKCSISGAECRCVAYRVGESRVTELCFLVGDGTLCEVRQPTDRIEYSDYGPVGGMVFPRLVRLYVSERLFNELTLEEFTCAPSHDAALFIPPVGPDVQETCQNPEPMRPAKERRAELPYGMSGAFRGFIYFVVGTDGRAHNPTVIWTSDLRFGAVLLKLVPEWRFHPASCAGVPVETSATLEYEYYGTP